jgi:hypothetical protein
VYVEPSTGKQRVLVRVLPGSPAAFAEQPLANQLTVVFGITAPNSANSKFNTQHYSYFYSNKDYLQT